MTTLMQHITATLNVPERDVILFITKQYPDGHSMGFFYIQKDDEPLKNVMYSILQADVNGHPTTFIHEYHFDLPAKIYWSADSTDEDVHVVECK